MYPDCDMPCMPSELQKVSTHGRKRRQGPSKRARGLLIPGAVPDTSQVAEIAGARTRTHSSDGVPLLGSDVHLAVTGISQPAAVVQCVVLFPSRAAASLDEDTMRMLLGAEVPVLASEALYRELKGPQSGSHALVLLDSGANAIRASYLMPSCVSIGFDDMLRTTAALAMQMAFPMLTIPVNWQIPAAPAKSVVAARASPAWARLKQMLSWWKRSDQQQHVTYMAPQAVSTHSDAGPCTPGPDGLTSPTVRHAVSPGSEVPPLELGVAKPAARPSPSPSTSSALSPVHRAMAAPTAPHASETGAAASAARSLHAAMPSQAELDRIAASSTCPAHTGDPSTPYVASWVPESTCQDWFPGADSLGLPSHKVYLRPVPMPWHDAAQLIELSRKMRECLAKYRSRGNRAAREKKRRLLASMGMEQRRTVSGAGGLPHTEAGSEEGSPKADGLVVTDATGLGAPRSRAGNTAGSSGSAASASASVWRGQGGSEYRPAASSPAGATEDRAATTRSTLTLDSAERRSVASMDTSHS